MARSFSGTDVIDVGSNAVLDNLNVGTILAWVYTTLAAPAGTVYAKGTSTARLRLQHTSNSYQVEIARATTLHNVVAADANCPGFGINKWSFVAYTWDLSLADADQRIITGDRTTVCAEASAYSTQINGAGAKGDDSGANGQLGRFGATSAPWQGALGIVQVLNRQITLAEARSWQWYPHYLTGTVGLWVPGWDNGTTVPDLSGNANAGTITGTTLFADVPLDLAESLFGDADDDANEPWDWAGGPAAGGSGWPDRRRSMAAIIASGLLPRRR